MWVEPNQQGIDLADGSEVFSLNFDVIGIPQDDMPLTFDFSYVPPQVVLSECALADPIFEDGTIQVGIDDFENIGLDVELMPNPIRRNETSILEFRTELPHDLEIEIFDTSGRLLTKNQVNIPIGLTNFELMTPQNSGVYLVKITTAENLSHTLKLIVI